MPAMTSQSAAFRAVLLALLAGAAASVTACGGDQDPMAPSTADPFAETAADAPVVSSAAPELLTAGTGAADLTLSPGGARPSAPRGTHDLWGCGSEAW